MDVFRCPAEGKTLRTDRDATDLIGEALGVGSRAVTIPVSRLDPDFFRLRTGVAGAFLQKFVTYGVHLTIAGDIADYITASDAFRDFVIESNRGANLRFEAKEGHGPDSPHHP
jgi:hypothetical protein